MNKEFSEAIRKLRIEKDLSQEGLSEHAGLSLRTIQRLENGESEPRGDTLKRLADALDKSTDYFREFTDSSNSRPLIIIPWYVIGFTLLLGSVGVIFGLTLVNLEVIPRNDISLEIFYGIVVFFIALGIIVGNIIEKRNKR
ncbi:MAG: helix-turn-helix transcriptional regulator [Cyclobacteriaceae bacterium]